ncbi:MAG: acyl-CoA thioesterase II [Hyphomicrobiaceae bacterium]
MAKNEQAAAAAAPPVERDPVASLLRVLDLEQIGEHRFQGHSPPTAWGRVYGGQVLAQSLVAASRTVGIERPIHSLHGYFLIGGDPAVPIVYDVDLVRDGGSFATRRVTALQGGKPIFEMLSSFHKMEEGLHHANTMPDVPAPEDVLPIGEVFAQHHAQIPDTMRAYYSRERPIDLRLIDTERYFGGQELPPLQRFWMRTRRALPDDAYVHCALLAYASDFALIDTALIPHGKVMFDPKMQLASLDHALWIHTSFRADAWMLYVLESPAAGRGRGFARGSFYKRDGTLIASIAQEGLMRERSTAFVLK